MVCDDGGHGFQQVEQQVGDRKDMKDMKGQFACHAAM